MSGQSLSQSGQTGLAPFERAPRPMAGYAADYKSGHETGLHRHPRAQLLFATAGVMRVTTEVALFTVPPGTGLWVPADTVHAVRMDGDVRMRALFLRADAAASGPSATTVIAVSPLLRELILTVCAEPVVWDARGPMRLVAALGAARNRPRDDSEAVIAGVPGSEAGARRRRTGCRSRRSARPASACRGRRGLGSHLGASVPLGNRHEFSPMAAPVADDRGVVAHRPGDAAGAGWRGGGLRQRAGLWGRVPRDLRDHAGVAVTAPAWRLRHLAVFRPTSAAALAAEAPASASPLSRWRNQAALHPPPRGVMATRRKPPPAARSVSAGAGPKLRNAGQADRRLDRVLPARRKHLPVGTRPAAEPL